MNPKDAIGQAKPCLSRLPMPVIFEVGLAMEEGAAKYGPFNWREAGIRTDVYTDAAFRHITQWIEGEDIDSDSGLSHITKAIASLVILRDGILGGNAIDSRPPRCANRDWMDSLKADKEKMNVILRSLIVEES